MRGLRFMSFRPPDTSWIETLPEGHQGTWRTLEAMRYLVRKDYQTSLVRSVVTDLQAEARALGIGPVLALFLFARDGIRFVDDPPGVEKVADFKHTMDAGCGDCDDKCVWLATALMSVGISVRFVVQSVNGDEWDHVYLEFYDYRQWKWTALDPTADGHTGVWAHIGWRQQLPAHGYEMRFHI